MIVGVLALFALATLSACSGGSSTTSTSSEASSSSATSTSAATAPSATSTSAAAAAPTPFPASARYMADMVSADGKKMAIGISVDGDQVTAYACNGVDDEAWFFGNQTDGTIDIPNKFRDTLAASFNGTDLTGDLTMNGTKYAFTAAAVSAPAGMYTADLDGARASWIVRPDGSVTGVQFNGGISGRDFEQAEQQQLNAAQFQSQVRNKRILQQADQQISIQNGTLTSKINGRTVTGKLVTGTTRFS